jgi:hypothetical protein
VKVDGWPVAGRAKTLFELEPRGPVEAKHERTHEMFFLNRLKHQFSRDEAGQWPNESFASEYGGLTLADGATHAGIVVALALRRGVVMGPHNQNRP